MTRRCSSSWSREADVTVIGSAPFRPFGASTGFEHLDHVQELTPPARDYVIRRGADPGRHTVVPLGFRIHSLLVEMSPADRRALRERLRLPRARKVVLSVAALNRSGT